MKIINPEQLIKALRESDEYIESIYMGGGCYQFYLFLKVKDAVEFLTNKNPNCELGLYYEECNEYQIGGDCSRCDYYLTNKS